MLSIHFYKVYIQHSIFSMIENISMFYSFIRKLQGLGMQKELNLKQFFHNGNNVY